MKMPGRPYRLLPLLACMAGGVVLALDGHVAAQSKRSWKPPPEANRLKNPAAASATAAENGGKLFRQYCADCHGAKGDGNGAMAGSLKLKPADLTSSPTQALTDGEIFWRISKGDSIMPSFETTFPLPEIERWQLVQFIRTLRRKK